MSEVVLHGMNFESQWPSSIEEVEESVTEESEKEFLKKRVGSVNKMGPELMLLVTNIVAAVCSFYWQQRYLSGVFLATAGGSTYLAYQGTRNVTPEQFNESFDTLKQENDRLQTSNDTLSSQLKEQRVLLNGLQNQNTVLETSNVQLKNSVSHLEQNVQDLDHVRTTLQKELDAEVAQLNILQKGLSTIQASAKQDHASFAGQLVIFVEQVDLLKKTREQYGQASQEVHNQSASVLEAATVVKEIFAQIKEWKDGDEVNRRLSMAQDLGAKVSAFQRQLEIQQVQIEERKKELDRLTRIRMEFGNMHERFLTVASEMRQTSSSLAQVVKHYDPKD